MEVFRVGSAVFIGKDIPAMITAVCIRDSGVTYETVWWDGRTRKQEWLQADEISDEKVPSMQIGFKNE